MSRYILFIALFTVRLALAAESWPADSRALVEAQNAKSPPTASLTNPFTMTVVDGLRLNATGWERVHPGSETVLLLAASDEFRAPDGVRSGLRVHLWRRDDGGPLLVYLPGIFQGAHDADTSRVVFTMLQLGYQIAVLPNPLSAEYMSSFPTAPPNASAREARIVREAIAELWSREGGSRVRVLAASHGAGLAARVYAADQASPMPLVSDFTLLFPQKEINASIELVDSYISTPTWRDLPRAAIGALYQTSLRKFVKRRLRLFLRDREAGFRARLYTATAIDHLASYTNRAFGRTLTLKTVLDEYVAEPEVAASFANDEDRLMHWLERGRAARGNGNVRILTSLDDWTNRPGAWSDLPGWLRGSERTLILNHAGHAGVVAQEWFRRVLLYGMRIQ